MEGLKRLPETHLTLLPRMADFALWATACEPALWTAGAFWSAYCGNRDEAVEGVIEADHIAAAVRALMAERLEWTGTASQLLPALAGVVDEHVAKSKAWPDDGRVLSGRLRRAAAFLRKVGVEIDFIKQGRASTRIIRITRTLSSAPENAGPPSSASSASSASNDIKVLQRTIMDKPSSVPSSDAPRPPVADDDADDQGRDTVRHNPLKTEAADDADDADHHLPPCSAVPPRCRECGGPLDGTEPCCWIAGAQVSLHPGCQRPYLARPEAQAEINPI